MPHDRKDKFHQEQKKGKHLKHDSTLKWKIGSNKMGICRSQSIKMGICRSQSIISCMDMVLKSN